MKTKKLLDLIQVPYIQYLFTFWEKFVLTLHNLKSEINTIHLIFAQKLGPRIKPINIRTQKIDGIILDIYKMIVVTFLIINQANRVRFFIETFLVVNVSLKIVIRMFFLILNNTNINFLEQELRWKTDNTKKAFSTIKHIKLVEKKKFAAAAFNSKYEIFIIYIVSFTSFDLSVYLSHGL